jgi:hypothetical protein
LGKRPEKLSKVVASGAGEDAWDVLKDNPSGLESGGNLQKGKDEVPARVSKSAAVPCDAKGLAWWASGQKLNCSSLKFPVFMLRNVS